MKYTDFNRRTPFALWAFAALLIWATVAAVALLIRG